MVQINHSQKHSKYNIGHSHSPADLCKDEPTFLSRESTNPVGSKFRLALVITLAFVVVEFVAGWVGNSLALVSDAGHNFSDGLALGFSWWALIMARQSPTARKTYGFHRAGILAASLNSLTLVIISFFIIFEAFQRFFHPVLADSLLMIGVSAVALVLNLTAARLLHFHAHHDLNVRSAFLHLATDAAASAGVIIAGIGQFITNWPLFDPLVSFLIGLLILGSCWGIIRESTNVLLEGIPAGLNMERLAGDLKQLEGVREVHHLHAWSIGSGLPALSCHLQLAGNATLQQATQTIQAASQMVEEKYQISHSTIQVEYEKCEKECNM